ncbi:MAG: hypothetical protein IKO07_05915, partial [Clostridia bacterium]|nr:hypothetical protein [Clostridia bacterium]
MKERAQMRSVAALGGSALVFRVFALEAADVPGARPALWLSALLGALMALPAALPLARGGDSLRAGAWNSRAACGILCAASLWDAAVAARLFSALAAYAALPDHAVSALSLPAIAVATLVCLMGAGAMSAAGVVWR